MAVPLTVGHLLQSVGNAVLSFPVCNCFKNLAGRRSHNRRTVLSRAAAEGLALKCPSAWLRLCGIYFSVRKYGLSGLPARAAFRQHRHIPGLPSFLPPARSSVLWEEKVEAYLHEVPSSRVTSHAGRGTDVASVRLWWHSALVDAQ